MDNDLELDAKNLLDLVAVMQEGVLKRHPEWSSEAD